jgi:hypothetical protein
MNGRIYDPLLGRFLSADIVVQFPGDLQSYNRYAYVRNNPLTNVDQSGFDETTTYSMVQTQNWIALNKAYGSDKANKIMGSTNLGSAAGTAVGAVAFYAVAPAIEGLVKTIKDYFTGNNDAGSPGPQPPGTQAQQQTVQAADQQSTTPKPDVDQAKPQENSSDGKVDSQQTDESGKKGVAPYQTGTYGELKKQEQPGDGLHIDHQPSNASNVAREEQAQGQPLTPEQAAQVKRDGPAIAVPAEKHIGSSPTYGGRNTPAQIQQDAANPVEAAKRDGQAMVGAADDAQKEAAKKAAEENLERVKKLLGGS